jgi:CHAD domain-containing protein
LAAENRSIDNLHAWRIATKRLRYRAELLADSGNPVSKPLVKDLKEIQTALGDWHDRCVLMDCAGEFLARPDFLVQHPDLGGALLADMEKERQRSDAAVESTLGRAAKMRKRWSNRQIHGENRSAESKD